MRQCTRETSALRKRTSFSMALQKHSVVSSHSPWKEIFTHLPIEMVLRLIGNHSFSLPFLSSRTRNPKV